MTRIGLISDTHNFLDEKILDHFKDCDEIWHAGDFGNIELAEKLGVMKPVRGVFGNIDGNDVRSIYPETLIWICEDVKIVMKHIGGSPPKYNAETLTILKTERPQLFISGHSH
ncbi:MAG: metallophosphoesterase, partial [Chitinophagaceae bacterium]